jgi:hypothetical protein
VRSGDTLAFSSENLKGRYHLEVVSVDGWKVLKLLLVKKTA